MPSISEAYQNALRTHPLMTKAFIGFIGAAASNIVAQVSLRPGRARAPRGHRPAGC